MNVRNQYLQECANKLGWSWNDQLASEQRNKIVFLFAKRCLLNFLYNQKYIDQKGYAKLLEDKVREIKNSMHYSYFACLRQKIVGKDILAKALQSLLQKNMLTSQEFQDLQNIIENSNLPSTYPPMQMPDSLICQANQDSSKKTVPPVAMPDSLICQANQDSSKTTVPPVAMPDSFVFQTDAVQSSSSAEQDFSSSSSSIFAEDFTMQKFGSYEILREIGSGGMGKVYEAYHESLQRKVAIKVISGQRHDEQRFFEEAKITAKLRHPNIIAIHDFGQQDKTCYIVMDLIYGKSLYELLKEKSFSIQRSLEIIRDVANALHFAHEKGIIHRDLKPANIMLENDVPIIMDFGLAKDLERETGITRSKAIIGTPKYMSPEQIGLHKKITALADVYALGAILYEMLTGKSVVSGKNTARIAFEILQEKVLPPHEYNPKIPVAVEKICLKALEKDPEKRYSSAKRMAYFATKQVPLP